MQIKVPETEEDCGVIIYIWSWSPVTSTELKKILGLF